MGKSNKKLIYSIKENTKNLFDIRYIQLQLQEKERKARYERQLFEAKIEAKTKNAKRKAKKLAKKIEFDAKNLYVQGGHFKNEILGMLTVFSANGYRKVSISRHIEYDPDDRKMYLNIYQRKDRNLSEKAKVVIYIHGGGWIGGFPDAREGITSRIAEQGYFVASLYYGEAPAYSHPKMIEKVYKALAYLKENANKYNIDMDEIVLTGESAGAHLSAMAGAISTNEEYKAHFNLDSRSKDQKIAALILDCGVYEMQELANINFKNADIYTQSYCGGTEVKDLDESMEREISPIYWVTKDFPPTFAISGDNDKLAVLTFEFVNVLFDNKVRVEHYHGTGKWAVHAFAVAQILKISRIALQKSMDFIKGILDK